MLLPLGAALCWSLVVAVARALDVTVTREADARAVQIGAGVLAAVLVVPLLLLARRRPGLAADLIVITTAAVLSGLLTLGLHGTQWGVGGLYADSSFRTEAATRYADSPALVDYAYADLPAYYPPALGWLQGRTAEVFGIAGWQTTKPLQLLLAGLVPLLAYALWRRVLDPLPAALVVAATSLLNADIHKADEWLVLACGVPWWLDAFRGVRADGVAAWSAWRHGVIAGLLLLVHTYYFLPLAVATLLGAGLDLARRRPLPLPVGRALVLVGVGVLVAAPYWTGLLLAQRSGVPADDLQRRYFYPGAELPAVPLPISVAGVLGMVGIGWLVVRRRDRLAAALATLLGAAYLTVVGGGITAALGLPLLTFKSNELIVSVQVAAGVLGLLLLSRKVASRPPVRDWSPARRLATTVLAVLLVVVPSTVYAALVWATGREVSSAQETRYPSGAWPDGWDGTEPTYNPAFVAFGDPSVEEVRQAWEQVAGRPADSSIVLVTSRVDLLATTPVHPFVVWKSIYSHPYGQFADRIALLRKVAACADSACAARLLRDNPYDAVDGLVLEQGGSLLVLPLLVDDFPNRNTRADVYFPAALFDAPEFTLRTVGDDDQIVVVALR